MHSFRFCTCRPMSCVYVVFGLTLCHINKLRYREVKYKFAKSLFSFYDMLYGQPKPTITKQKVSFIILFLFLLPNWANKENIHCESIKTNDIICS